MVVNDGKSFRMLLLQVNMSEMMGDRAQTMSSQGLQNLAKSLENSTGTSWGGSEFCKYKTIPLLTLEAPIPTAAHDKFVTSFLIIIKIR